MGLLNWLTGAANRSAGSSRRGGRSNNNNNNGSHKKKPKKKKTTRPSNNNQGGGSRGGGSRGGGNRNGHGGNSRKTTPRNNTHNPFKPPTFNANTTKAQQRYNSFKASGLAPKVTDTTQKKNDKGWVDYLTKYDAAADARQAYEKGKNITYLGTEQKATTTKLLSDSKQKAEYKKRVKEAKTQTYSSEEWKATKKEIQKQNDKGWVDYLTKEYGISKDQAKDWLKTEEGKKARRETYVEAKKATIKEINKGIRSDIKKDVKDTYNLKSVNALTKSEFDKMTTAQRMGTKQGNKYLENVGGDKLLYKIGSKNAQSAYKGKFITGVMQGSGYADVLAGSVGKNNKAATEAIRQTKESKSYLGGYVAGQVGGFALNKTAAMGRAIAGGAAKVSTKSLGTGIGKQFMKNRLGEMVAESGMNALDAAKLATDEYGNIDKKQLRNFMLLNTALTGGMGGAMEGVAMKKASSNVKKLTELLGKQQAGKITADELKQLNKVRDTIRKTAANSPSLSGDISAKGLEDIKSATSEARIQRAKAKSEARQPRIDEEFAQAKAERTQRKWERVQDSIDRGRAAQKHADNADAVTVKAREAERVRLEDKANDLRKQLADADNAVKKDNTMLGHETAMREREKIQKDLEQTESMLRANKLGTPSGRVEANIKAKKSARTIGEYDALMREGEALQAELAANTRNAVAGGAKTTARETVEEVAETAEQKAVRDLDSQISRAENNLKRVSDPDEADQIRAHIDELKQERNSYFSDEELAWQNTKKAERNLTAATTKEAEARNAYEEALETGDEATINVAKKNYDNATAAREAADAEFSEASKIHGFAKLEGEYADEVGIHADEEVKKAEASGKEVTKADKDAIELSKMKEDLAQIDDEIALTKKKLAEATGDGVGAVRKELDGLRQQRMVVESAVEKNASREALMQASDELGKAITKQKSGVGKLIAKANRGFVDSFGDWEKVFRSFDDPALRDKAFAKLQKLRMSRSEAGSKVFDEFLDMYETFGLVGRKNKQKLADFERYTFLMHELERSMDGTGFTGMKPAEVSAEIKRLEGLYGKELTQFQQKVVKYFDELLDRDVASGFETAEHAAELRSKFHNYVPTFRDVDGVDAISRAKPYEEINFHRVHAAVGGDTWDVLPLHKQAMQKTQATLIRQNENDLVSFVAEIAQVNRKDLISGKTPKEYLESTTMTIKDPKTGKYSVAYFVDGEKKSLQISEGMYKGIRQWTGEDRAFFMNCKLLNTVTGKINRWFKDWITDYSLIFGARNFIRDIETGLFYSSNPIRYAKNIPRAVSCVLADTKAGKALVKSKSVPESFRNYLAEGQALTQAYKKNGGRMSQLVSESDPYVMLKRLHRKSGPLGVIREINSTIETIPRMAEFASTAEEAAMKRSGMSKAEWTKMTPTRKRAFLNEAVSDPDTLARAMNRSKEVTLNFDRSGYIGRWLNSTFVPFFNPAIQGADKLTRVLVRDNHTAAQWVKMITMFGVIGQGTEVLLNTIYADNESYKRLSDYEKTGYYHIPMEVFGGDKDTFLKIPRAREVAAIQGPLDWYFQHVKYHCAGKDENLFGSFKSNAKMWYEQIGPVNPISDNVFYTPYRIAKNKTWYGGYIENYDDEEKIKAGKSDEVWDENTTSVAKAINKLMINAPNKLKFLGISDAQIKDMKTHVWSPKKIDDLMDSYLGVIYDMGIKNTSLKSPGLSESVSDLKEGKFLGGGKGLADMFGSSFANAFTVDSVMSNAYRSNQYARKADLQKELDLMTKGLEEGTDEYNKVIQSKEYKDVNAQMRRLNQSFAYTSVNYDNMMSNIYLRDDMSIEQKNFWAKKVKIEQNKLLYGRQQGDDVANADPMKWGYNVKRKDGSKLFSTDQLVDLCSFTYNDGNNAYKDSWNKYKKLNPKDKNGKSWMEITLGQREVNRFTGEPLSMMQYNVGAYVIESQKRRTGKTYEKVTASMEPFGNDTLKKEIERAGNYYDAGGNLGMYKYSHKSVVQAGIDLNLSTYGKKGKGMESWDIMNALARGRSKTGKRFTDLAYYAEGKYVSQRMNAARCLASNKYKDLGVDTANVNAFCLKHDFSYKGGGKETYPQPEEVEAAIRKDYDGMPSEVQAAVFEEICGTWVDNPFGKIGDYSLGNDTGVTDLDNGGWGYGGRGRRGGHGWGGWGYGGGGGGSTPDTTTDMSKYDIKLKTKDFTQKSNVNEAYRKKVRKLRKEAYKRPKS